MIDYKGIIDNITDDKIKALLDRLDVPYRDNCDYLICKTACHNTDVDNASWKLYYYKNTHLFHCYTDCGDTFSIFTFLKRYYEVRNYTYDWATDIYQVILDCSNYTFTYNNYETRGRYESIRPKFEKKKEIKKLEYYDAGVLSVFQHYYPIEWLNDGITKEAMDKFNILYSISQNKIIIPHYDIMNRLIGIRGRTLNKWEEENFGKYMPIQIENKWYSHPLSLNLYGLNKTKENIQKYGICYIVESEKSVLQADKFTIPNCTAAICGSQLNKFALNILIRACHPREVILCLDKEEKPGEHKYFDKLYDICKRYNNYANFSFVYDKNNLLNLKDSPTDKGEEVFKKLVERRIKI